MAITPNVVRLAETRVENEDSLREALKPCEPRKALIRYTGDWNSMGRVRWAQFTGDAS